MPPTERRCLNIVKIAPTGFFADYGCHVRILEETRALSHAGHRVTIFTYPSGVTPPGLDVRRTPGLPGARSPRVGSHWRKLLLDPLLTGRVLAGSLTARVDVVHAHLHEGALIGWLLSRLKRAPLIFDYQGSLTGEMLDHQFVRPNNPALRMFGLLERLANAAADRILTSSENARRQLLDSAALPPERVVAVPDGVDLRRFRPRDAANAAESAQLRARLGIPPDRLIVGYLGLLAEYQGTGDLIRAAGTVIRAFPGAQFLVMGYPNVEAYRAAAATAGLAGFCTFTGRVAYADAPAFLRLADLAVSPKRSETEGNGKLLNYMASGLPTVAYRGAVATEFLGPDAILAETGSPAALAEAILGLLRDDALRGRYGAALRQRAVERYSWATTIQPALRVYDELTRRG